MRKSCRNVVPAPPRPYEIFRERLGPLIVSAGEIWSLSRSRGGRGRRAFDVKRGVRQILVPPGNHAVALIFREGERDWQWKDLDWNDIRKTRMMVKGGKFVPRFFCFLTFFLSSCGEPEIFSAPRQDEVMGPAALGIWFLVERTNRQLSRS